MPVTLAILAVMRRALITRPTSPPLKNYKAQIAAIAQNLD